MLCGWSAVRRSRFRTLPLGFNERASLENCISSWTWRVWKSGKNYPLQAFDNNLFFPINFDLIFISSYYEFHYSIFILKIRIDYIDLIIQFLFIQLNRFPLNLIEIIFISKSNLIYNILIYVVKDILFEQFSYLNLFLLKKKEKDITRNVMTNDPHCFRRNYSLYNIFLN